MRAERAESRSTRLPRSRANFKQLVRESGAKGNARSELEAALARLTARGELIELRGDQYVVTALALPPERRVRIDSRVEALLEKARVKMDRETEEKTKRALMRRTLREELALPRLTLLGE